MLFSTGQPQSIADVLQDKDKRVAFQQMLLKKYPTAALLVVKLNIPGEIKYNNSIDHLFTVGYNELKKSLFKNKFFLADEFVWRHPAGETAFIVVNSNGNDLKLLSVNFEETYKLGRLFDVDVLTRKGTISRKQLNLPVRRCLICERPAKECARSRRHTLDDLKQTIESKWDTFQQITENSDYRDKIIDLAQKSLLYEVTVNPKPGLVDPHNHDSHPDMDIFTFIDSSLSLRPYFCSCFDAGWNFAKKDLQELFKEIRPLGVAAEKKMFTATNGVNTHKGAIFSLGIVVTATAYVYHQNNNDDVDNILKIIRDMCHDLVENDFKNLRQLPVENLTAGQKQYLDFGLTGIRGEVQQGFPTIVKWGLPYLNKVSLNQDLNQRLLNVLLQLALHTVDSNLIKRANYSKETINKAHQLINEYFEFGAEKTASGRSTFNQILAYFKQKNLSLGGTADLLIVTIFLGLLTDLL
ncbi:MAG: triphosphoribosyl-dephospho-CoA synthase CitG [Liquorilactobacillus ghanensis]|uniref:triphosphoribosyl-dephospho-CoA synthase CitG n=1 Tax=Liquorilactobacillus ghanensis TaxID=399370 RepID=UPI0039ECA70C